MFLLSPFIFEKYFKKGKARGGGEGVGSWVASDAV